MKLNDLKLTMSIKDVVMLFILSTTSSALAQTETKVDVYDEKKNNPIEAITAKPELVKEDVDDLTKLNQQLIDCNNDRECDSTKILSQIERLEKKKEEAAKEINCSVAKNGLNCKAGTGYTAASQQVSQITSAYSQAAAANDLASAESQYQNSGAGLNTTDAVIHGTHMAAIDAQQAANRQKTIAGLGGTIASANYASALVANKEIKKQTDALSKIDCDGLKPDQLAACRKNYNDTKTLLDNAVKAKAANSQAAIGSLMAAVQPTMMAFSDQQTANDLRAREENLRKYALANRGTNQVIQYDGMNPLTQYANPHDTTQESPGTYDPNLLGTGMGIQQPGAIPEGGALVWNGAGPGPGSAGGGAGSASLPGDGSLTSPYVPPQMDPNANRPTYANIDETGGGYRAGIGTGNVPQKLDMNSMLAQYLPRDGVKAEINGVEKLGVSPRKLASDPVSLLDANVNIFERISDTYHRKAKAGAIKL